MAMIRCLSLKISPLFLLSSLICFIFLLRGSTALICALSGVWAYSRKARLYGGRLEGVSSTPCPQSLVHTLYGQDFLDVQHCVTR